MVSSPVNRQRRSTLFTNLVQADIQEPIYLVCKIVRNGALKITNTFNSAIPVENPRRGSESSVRENSASGRWDTPPAPNNAHPGTNLVRSGTILDNTTGQFRRPFGYAVLELTQLRDFVKDNTEVQSNKEHTMPICVAENEAVCSMLHQDIKANNTKEFAKSPRSAACFLIRLF